MTQTYFYGGDMPLMTRYPMKRQSLYITPCFRAWDLLRFIRHIIQKPFRRLMGTTCNLSWREDGDMERVWVIKPSHPIAQGIDRYFEIEHEETYAEPFDIPEPDELVFGGWYEGGEIFRSGCCFYRGNGKIFYFQPDMKRCPYSKIKMFRPLSKTLCAGQRLMFALKLIVRT